MADVLPAPGTAVPPWIGRPTPALTDLQWAALAPMIEACRPQHRTEHHELRRTIEAILWRHRRGITWRGLPARFGPWWMAAQTCIRWRRLGAWQRLAALPPPRDGSLDDVLAVLATLGPPAVGGRPARSPSHGDAFRATGDHPG